jgi:hypothetical protein
LLAERNHNNGGKTVTKDQRYKDFAMRFAFEAGNQMRLLFDRIEALRQRAEKAEAVVSMASSRLGECNEGNLLQRVDILREQEKCLSQLVASVGDKATETVYACPDDAYDLNDILERSRIALEMKVS